MYSAGVIIGMNGHYFNGGALTSRAQMATIITRLLMPSQRISTDSAENANMADFEGSLENDCVTVKVGSYYYCAFKYYPRALNGSAGSQVYALYQTDGKDNAQEVYTCPGGARLSDVSSYQNKVYFSVTYPGSNKGSLMRYDPATGETTEIFSKYAVKSYCWYGGDLYVLAFTNYGYDAAGKKDYIENDRYTFGMVSGGEFVQLAGPYTYYQVMNFQPYGYMGKIFFNVSSYSGPTNLYSYDLSTDQTAKVSDKKHKRQLFQGPCHVFSVVQSGRQLRCQLVRHVPWQSRNMWTPWARIPPTAPPETARCTAGTDTYTVCRGQVGKLYRMDAAGKSLTVINALGAYNSATFAADKIILMPNSFITSNPNEMKVYNLSSYSARHLYGDFIGCSCWYKGARFMADDGVSVYSSTATVSTIKNIEIQVTEAYFAGNDFIVRAKYINNSGQSISALRKQYVNVYVNGTLAAASVNDFVSMNLVINDVQTFTFVIGKPDQTEAFDLSRGSVKIEITPTFEYASSFYQIKSAAPTNGTYSVSVNNVIITRASQVQILSPQP
jgi:hypothetical protein